jgi:hypothetical protein
MRGKSKINKTWRLLHIYIFVKGPIKKGIMDIQLINFPNTRNHNGENQPNSGLLNNMTKSLRIINTFLLIKAFSNQPSFVVLNVATYMTLDLVHPTTTNNIHQMMKRNQRSSVIRTQCLNFIFHSTVLSRIPVSIIICN